MHIPGVDGDATGLALGTAVGPAIVGAGVGDAAGLTVGTAVGPALVGAGLAVGTAVGPALVGAGVAGAEDPVDTLVWNHARICSRPGPAITPVLGYGRQSPLQRQVVGPPLQEGCLTVQ